MKLAKFDPSWKRDLSARSVTKTKLFCEESYRRKRPIRSSDTIFGQCTWLLLNVAARRVIIDKQKQSNTTRGKAMEQTQVQRIRAVITYGTNQWLYSEIKWSTRQSNWCWQNFLRDTTIQISKFQKVTHERRIWWFMDHENIDAVWYRAHVELVC